MRRADNLATWQSQLPGALWAYLGLYRIALPLLSARLLSSELCFGTEKNDAVITANLVFVSVTQYDQ